MVLGENEVAYFTVAMPILCKCSNVSGLDGGSLSAWRLRLFAGAHERGSSGAPCYASYITTSL